MNLRSFVSLISPTIPDRFWHGSSTCPTRVGAPLAQKTRALRRSDPALIRSDESVSRQMTRLRAVAVRGADGGVRNLRRQSHRSESGVGTSPCRSRRRFCFFIFRNFNDHRADLVFRATVPEAAASHVPAHIPPRVAPAIRIVDVVQDHRHRRPLVPVGDVAQLGHDVSFGAGQTGSRPPSTV